MPPLPPPDPEPPAWVRPVDVGYLRARRVTIAGLFLGWAGPGLAVGGTVVGLGGAEPAGLDGRRLIEVCLVGGAAVSAVGLGLQVAGSWWSSARLRAARLDDPRRRRALGLGLAVGGVVLGGLAAWRVLERSPDGLWLPVAGGGSLALTLGSTALHTAVQLDTDSLVERGPPGLELGLGPRGLVLRGRF